jgi:hypothetical protein
MPKNKQQTRDALKASRQRAAQQQGEEADIEESKRLALAIDSAMGDTSLLNRITGLTLYSSNLLWSVSWTREDAEQRLEAFRDAVSADLDRLYGKSGRL